jgi:hypothetical protein
MFERSGASITETARAVNQDAGVSDINAFQNGFEILAQGLAVKTQHQRRLPLLVQNGSVMRPVSMSCGFSLARANATAA